MPFNVDAPMVQTNNPARYPEPDWRKSAEVRECWMPDEKPVGWLVIQDDEALSWLSSVGPSRPAAHALKELIQEVIVDSLAQNMPPRDAWNRVMTVGMFRAPELMDLRKLSARIAKEWS